MLKLFVLYKWDVKRIDESQIMSCPLKMKLARRFVQLFQTLKLGTTFCFPGPEGASGVPPKFTVYDLLL